MSSSSGTINGRSPAHTRQLSQFARSVVIDPRIPALLPGFDAPFLQAGLAGYSDSAMRLIARRHGCPFCITEALLDRTLINGGKGLLREDPDLLAEECGTGDIDENRAAGFDDHPTAGQLMGTNPEEMARAAALLVEMGYDVIDVNLACPVKKVCRRNRGGHFMAAPEDAIKVLRAVRDAVPENVPTTVKLRRAFDDTPAMARSFERIFNAAYDMGYAWAIVHCRTVQQRYLGPGKWPFLAELTERHSDKIILGSGDVWTVADIFAMLRETGVNAVSVARGCIGNPWIFRQARQLMAGESPELPTLAQQRQVLLDHFMLSAALHGEGKASRMMRKFGIKFAQHHPQRDDVHNEFVRCKSIEEWHAVLDQFYTTSNTLVTA
jgi:tRNA-dihydrouridine synthase B